MGITIEVSEATEAVLRREADLNGKKVSEFLEEFVETSFPSSEDDGSQVPDLQKPHDLFRMAGMFSSGVTDTSERMQEILYSEDLDPAQGFGTSK